MNKITCFLIALSFTTATLIAACGYCSTSTRVYQVGICNECTVSYYNAPDCKPKMTIVTECYIPTPMTFSMVPGVYTLPDCELLYGTPTKIAYANCATRPGCVF